VFFKGKRAPHKVYKGISLFCKKILRTTEAPPVMARLHFLPVYLVVSEIFRTFAVANHIKTENETKKTDMGRGCSEHSAGCLWRKKEE
jgi:hypothetical protein